MSHLRSPASKRVAVVVSLTGAAIILCIGGAIAIAAPKFMRFQGRGAQSECKMNLKQLALAQRRLFAESKRYTEKLSELDAELEPRDRYLYALGPRDFVPAKDGAEPKEVLMKALPSGVVPGVVGVCPQCTVTIVCVGAREPVLHDVWRVTLGPLDDSFQFENVRDVCRSTGSTAPAMPGRPCGAFIACTTRSNTSTGWPRIGNTRSTGSRASWCSTCQRSRSGFGSSSSAPSSCSAGCGRSSSTPTCACRWARCGGCAVLPRCTPGTTPGTRGR